MADATVVYTHGNLYVLLYYILTAVYTAEIPNSEINFSRCVQFVVCHVLLPSFLGCVVHVGPLVLDATRSALHFFGCGILLYSAVLLRTACCTQLYALL